MNVGETSENSYEFDEEDTEDDDNGDDNEEGEEEEAKPDDDDDETSRDYACENKSNLFILQQFRFIKDNIQGELLTKDR